MGTAQSQGVQAGWGIEKSRAYSVNGFVRRRLWLRTTTKHCGKMYVEDFYQVLIDTVSERAAELKQKAPKDRLNALIQQIVSHLWLKQTREKRSVTFRFV